MAVVVELSTLRSFAIGSYDGGEEVIREWIFFNGFNGIKVDGWMLKLPVETWSYLVEQPGTEDDLHEVVQYEGVS